MNAITAKTSGSTMVAVPLKPYSLGEDFIHHWVS